MEALLSAYLRSTVIALPLLLILIGMGAWWLVQRGLAPLQQFSRVAAQVSTQDLTHRLALDNLPKELGELAQGINFMLHRLDDGVRQLSQFSDDLAHELRAPLTNLMGKAQVTLSRERLRRNTKRAWNPASRKWNACRASSPTCCFWPRSAIRRRGPGLPRCRWVTKRSG